MWKRTVGGRNLHFRLAGINNQNFIMRDEETGSYWQQVSGKAISGPLRGQSLEGVHSDELTFDLWKQESPSGLVLAPVAAYEAKYESNWEPDVAKLSTPLDFPGSGLKARDIVLGIQVGNQTRAYPMNALSPALPLHDRLGGVPLLLVMNSDGKSVRGFVSRIAGVDAEFFRKDAGASGLLVDSLSASEWNFQGCAIAGESTGKCLQSVDVLKDYWFDWRNYHPDTSVYKQR